MKISRSHKRLGDDVRGNHGPVAPYQLPVGLVGKENLRQAGDHQGINQPQQHGGDDCHQHGNQRFFFMVILSQAIPMRVMTMSINLMPINGTMIPPTP